MTGNMVQETVRDWEHDLILLEIAAIAAPLNTSEPTSSTDC